MKKFALLLILLGLFAAAQPLIAQSDAAAPPREFPMQEGDTTYIMKQFVMVLLYAGDKADEFSEEELNELQRGHMENINRLAEAGKVVVAGPMGDDTELRGILIMDVATVEEAEALVATDPMIEVGRLRAECHPWWTAKGTVIK